MSGAPLPEAEPFDVRLEPERDRVRVIPVGELDVATVGELDAKLRELIDAGFRTFVVDLRELTFMDSTGLHWCLALDAVARRDGMELVLIPGLRSVQRVFEIAGLDERLPFRSA
jgi:anti-anti-sigma factor